MTNKWEKNRKGQADRYRQMYFSWGQEALTEEQQLVISSLFGYGRKSMTIKKFAPQLNYCESKIRRIKKAAIAALLDFERQRPKLLLIRRQQDLVLLGQYRLGCDQQYIDLLNSAQKLLRQIERDIELTVQIDIGDIDLSSRAFNALFRFGVRNIKDLIDLELGLGIETVSNLGITSQQEVRQKASLFLESATCLQVLNSRKRPAGGLRDRSTAKNSSSRQQRAAA